MRWIAFALSRLISFAHNEALTFLTSLDINERVVIHGCGTARARSPHVLRWSSSYQKEKGFLRVLKNNVFFCPARFPVQGLLSFYGKILHPKIDLKLGIRSLHLGAVLNGEDSNTKRDKMERR